MYITRYPPPANWSRLLEEIEIDLNVFEEGLLRWDLLCQKVKIIKIKY